MPYKSLKQERYFHAAEERGEISPKVVKEFDQASKGLKLPERVKKKSLHEARIQKVREDHLKKFWRGGKS